MADSRTIELVDIIGSRGKYQTFVFIVSFYSSWFLGTAVLTMDLLAPMVTMYWDWDASNPNKTTFSSDNCKMDDILELNRTSSLSNWNSTLIYESKYSRHTLTEKLNLVCERSWLVSLANLLSLIGNGIGSMMIGFSEIYGRNPFIIGSAVLSTVLTLCMTFPVHYVMFAVPFCLFRGCISMLYKLLFIQAVEVTSPSVRPYIGILVKSGVLIGQSVFVGAAWLIEDWFYTQLFHTILVATLLPVLWHLLESPVWLAVRGRYDDAKGILVKLVNRNGLDLNEAEPKINAWLEQMKVRCEIETRAEKGKVKDLFKNKRITLYTIGLTYTTFTLSFTYNGLVFNSESFGSGLYMDLTVSNAMSLVAVLIIAVFLKKVSVRLSLCIILVLEAVTCVIYSITYGSPLARTVVSVLCRVFISPLYAIYNIYVNEVYPTSVRGVGSGFTSFISISLSSISSFTKELGHATSMYVPFILFAALSLTSSLVYKLMPEMRNKPIIHTVNELKNLGKRRDELQNVQCSRY